VTRSDLHVVTGHDGSSWLGDSLVEGDYERKVREILGGEPDNARTLIPGVSQAFYRGACTVLVMTFAPEVSRRRAEEIVYDIGEDRDDVN
jgi:hypothetical protein